MNAGTPANYTKGKAQQLQNTLYLAAKENPKRRFHALYDKVYREDIMRIAWRRVKANSGSAGIDQETIDLHRARIRRGTTSSRNAGRRS